MIIRNEENNNSQNSHLQKTMHTSYGDMDIDISCHHNGEFVNHRLKKQNMVTVGYGRKDHIYVCKRNDYWRN